MTLIAAEDLAVGYEAHAVAQGISFEVNEGEFLSSSQGRRLTGIGGGNNA